MSDRVIVITGGHGVLGSALVEAALADGLSVAIIDHSPVRTPDKRVLAIGGVDLTDHTQAQTAFEQIAKALGRIDILANIAGGFTWQTTEDGDPAAWARMHALNVTTALNTSRAALPHLKASAEGRIINVGSAAALKAGAGMGAYAASKAGVHALTQGLAEELKTSSVTVNAVLPSIIDTPQNRTDMPDANPADWVAPDDLAAVILFLASPAARAVTGALVPVTGRV
jgi:NAD(P)-dependent dehydrogenase (short-subunit alcohol dehydrogenase family)